MVKSFKVALDRIEEGIAVLLVRDEEKIKVNIPLFLLPEGSREGDILDITIKKDVQETESARDSISKNRLFVQNQNIDKFYIR